MSSNPYGGSRVAEVPSAGEQANEVAPDAWVFAGGEFDVHHLPENVPGPEDLIVCVDHGLAHCLSAGFEPSLLLGDFDSVDRQLLDSPAMADVPRHQYPSAKASSDLELALELMAQRRLSSVFVLGVSGGRTDHMLFNWSLSALQHWPFRLVLIDETSCCHVLQARDSCTLAGQKGKTLSLLALKRATGVTTSGLEYPLQEAVLDVGSTLGLSNEFCSNEASVSIQEGTLLVIENRT